jgi:hypothetical protein
VGGPAPGTWNARRRAATRRYLVRVPVGIYAVKVRGNPLEFFEVSAGRRPAHVDVPR